MDAREVAAKLIDMEKERLIGWRGPPGAAYNAVSEYLQNMGLLNSNWSLSPSGEAVRAHLLGEG